MQNEEGVITELYIPRKWYLVFFPFVVLLVFVFVFMNLFCFWALNKYWLCECSSATNRLITSKDHASVQINVGHLDENGVYNGHFSTFALCGFVRAQVFVLSHFSV
jgi:energy-coupling factor transporter transmembrane protein EcfT